MIDARLLKNEGLPINTLHPEILAKIFDDLVDMEMRKDFLPLGPAGGSRPRRQLYKQPPLAAPFLNEPRMEEWRRFLKTVPAVITSVVGHLSSTPIPSALTLLSDEETTLSLFAEQRARLGNKLKTCDVTAELGPSILRHGWGQGWGDPSSWGSAVDTQSDDWGDLPDLAIWDPLEHKDSLDGWGDDFASLSNAVPGLVIQRWAI
ncbi:hypothetical protein BDN71DRAFT_1431732 [Pleurotus eryngii]|uniref:Uncharacterized protein n=1 Tax=Pleurotus eryngii TaxID=5323 RepID=A0A9P5ZVN5_PLEER|nr:hypothetical protein BDN71DRAFT_1431732 [Pleurotus eryngii]